MDTRENIRCCELDYRRRSNSRGKWKKAKSHPKALSRSLSRRRRFRRSPTTMRETSRQRSKSREKWHSARSHSREVSRYLARKIGSRSPYQTTYSRRRRSRSMERRRLPRGRPERSRSNSRKKQPGKCKVKQEPPHDFTSQVPPDDVTSQVPPDDVTSQEREEYIEAYNAIIKGQDDSLHIIEDLIEPSILEIEDSILDQSTDPGESQRHCSSLPVSDVGVRE